MYNVTLQSCLQEFTKKHSVSWAMWSLAGSYRIRSGTQGLIDTCKSRAEASLPRSHFPKYLLM